MTFYLNNYDTVTDIAINLLSDFTTDSETGYKTLRFSRGNITFLKPNAKGDAWETVTGLKEINSFDLRFCPVGFMTCERVEIDIPIRNFGNLFKTFYNENGTLQYYQWGSLKQVVLYSGIATSEEIVLESECFSFTRCYHPELDNYPGNNDFSFELKSTSLHRLSFVGSNHFRRKIRLNKGVIPDGHWVEQFMTVNIKLFAFYIWMKYFNFEEKNSNPFTDTSLYEFVYNYNEEEEGGTLAQFVSHVKAQINLNLYLEGNPWYDTPLCVGNDPDDPGNLFSSTIYSNESHLLPQSIKKFAFAGFKNIQKIDLSNLNITEIGEGAFADQTQTGEWKSAYIGPPIEGLPDDFDYSEEFGFGYYEIIGNSKLSEIRLVNKEGATPSPEVAVFGGGEEDICQSKQIFFKGGLSALNSLGKNCTLSKITITTRGGTLESLAVKNSDQLRSIHFNDFIDGIAEDMFQKANGFTQQIYVEWHGADSEQESIQKWANIKFSNLKSNPLWAATGRLSINGVENIKSEINLTLPISAYSFAGCTQLTKIVFKNQEISASNLEIGRDAFKNTSIKKIIIEDFFHWLAIDFISEESNPWYAAVKMRASPRITINDSKGILKSSEATDYLKNAELILKGFSHLKSYSLPLAGNAISKITISDDIDWIENSALYYNKKDGITSSLSEINLPFAGESKVIQTGTDALKKHFGYIFGSEESNQSLKELTQQKPCGPLLPYLDGEGNTKYYDFSIPNSLKTITIREGNIGAYSFYQWQRGDATGFDLTLGDKIEDIEESAFEESDLAHLYLNLEEASNTTSLESFGKQAFMNCKNLQLIQTQNSALVVDEDDSTYTNASDPFKDLTSIRQIGDYAFYHCNKVIPDINLSLASSANLQEIGRGAFACSEDSSQTETLKITLPFIGRYKTVGYNNIATEQEKKYGYIFYKKDETTIEHPSRLGKLEIKNAPYGVPEAAFGSKRQMDGAYQIEDTLKNRFIEITINRCGTQIGKNAFNGMTSLVKFTLIEDESGDAVVVNTIKTVDDYAFANCSLLKEIKLPNFATKIGTEVFSGCNALEKIAIPFLGSELNESKSFTYLFGNIPPSDLTYIYIDRGEIGTDSFKDINPNDDNKKGALSLELGSVLKINEAAFKDFQWLGKINIPTSCDYIGSNAFDGCDNLSRIIIKYRVDKPKVYDEDAFNGVRIDKNNNDNSAKCLIHSSSLAGWCASTFKNKESNPLVYFENLYLLETLKSSSGDIKEKLSEDELKSILESYDHDDVDLDQGSIGDFAWEIQTESIDGEDVTIYFLYKKLTSLTKDKLEGVTSLTANAFSGWSGVTKVDLPHSIINIEKGTFAGCSNITEMAVPFVGKSKGAQDGEEVILGYWFTEYKEGDNYELDKEIISHYYIDKNGGIHRYRTPLGLTKIIFEGDYIGDYAFAGVTSLQEMNFSNARYIPPRALKRIGKKAFSGCVNIKSRMDSIVGSEDLNNVNTSKPSAFSFTIGSSRLGDTDSNNVYIDIKTKSIAPEAFENCFGNASKTYSIYFSKDLETIETDIDASNKEYAKILNNAMVSYLEIPFIGAHRHSLGDSKQDLLTVVEMLGDILGGNTEAHINITGETVLNKNALKDCTAIKTVTLNDNVLEIQEGAFEGCLNLQTINLPKHLQTLGANAFKNAFLASAANIVLDFGTTKLKTVKDNAFAGANLHTLILPNSVTEIGDLICDDTGRARNLLSILSVPFIPALSDKEDKIKYPSGLSKIIPQNVLNAQTSSLTVKVTRDPIAARAFSQVICPLTVILTPETEMSKIPSHAFAQCNTGFKLAFNLTDEPKSFEFTLPQGIVTIEDHAFWQQPFLEKVIIPKTVKNIEKKAFWVDDTTIKVRNFIFEKESLCEKIDLTSFGMTAGFATSIDNVFLNSINLLKITDEYVRTTDTNARIYCPLTMTELETLSKDLSMYKTKKEDVWEKMFFGIDHNDYPTSDDTPAAQKADFDYSVYIYDNAEKAFLPIQNAEVCKVKANDWRTELYYQGAEASSKTFSENYYFAELNSEWSKIYNMRATKEEGNEFLQDGLVPINMYEGAFRTEVNRNDYSFWLDFIEGNPTNATISNNLSQYNVHNIGRRTKVVTDTNTNCIYANEVPNYTYVYRTGDSSTPSLDSNAIQISEEVYKQLAIGGAQNSAFEKIQELLQNHTSYNETVNLSTIPIYHLDGNMRVTIVDQELGIDGDYLIQNISLPLSANGTSSISLAKCLEKTI